MRKIIVLSMITLDGVMQAPGGPKEKEITFLALKIKMDPREIILTFQLRSNRSIFR